jgi:hypothetical protein
MVRAYRDVLAVPSARALIGASAASQIGNWPEFRATEKASITAGIAGL